MSEQKHTDNLESWKTSIDELAMLPADELYDATAAWNKLDARLEKENSGKKAWWLWLAAACLVTALLIPRILMKEKTSVVPGSAAMINRMRPARESIQKPVAEALVALPLAVNKTTLTVPRRPITISRAKNKAGIEKPGYDKIVFTENAIAVIPDSDEEQRSTPQQRSTSKAVVFDILKNRLPVVHINDLEAPAKPAETLAGNSGRAAFKFRFLNREYSPDMSQQINLPGSRLQIKISPQN